MKQATVAVIHHSVTGTTARLGAAVAEGVERIPGISAVTLTIGEQDIEGARFRNRRLLEAATAADALILGSPTFMGCVSAQFKAFADATSELWAQQRWAGKLAAGFTVGINASGDQSTTIQYLSVFAAQHGMLWMGLDLVGGGDPYGLNRLGAQGGLIAHAPDGVVHDLDLETARCLGARVAGTARRLGR